MLTFPDPVFTFRLQLAPLLRFVFCDSLLLGPVAFWCIASAYVTRHILLENIAFNTFRGHTLSEMWAGLKSAPGCVGRLSQAFVYYMDFRFVGGWAPKNDSAKFWAFTLGAYCNREFVFMYMKRRCVQVLYVCLGGLRFVPAQYRFCKYWTPKLLDIVSSPCNVLVKGQCCPYLHSGKSLQISH